MSKEEKKFSEVKPFKSDGFQLMYTAIQKAPNWFYTATPVSTLSWGSIASGSLSMSPTTDATIDVRQATSIAVQGDTTHASNTSTSVDFNILSTVDGTNFDTVAYAEMNLGDGEVKTMLVSPGPGSIVVRIDNNGGSGTLMYGTARVYLRT